MDQEHELELIQRVQANEDRSKSNTKRLDKLEESTEAINRLATSMEVMAEKQDRVADTVEKLDGKVTTLESKPGKRWDAIVDKIVWAVLAAVIAYILGSVGL